MEKKSLCLKTYILNCRQVRVSIKDQLKAAESTISQPNAYSMISNTTPKIKHMPVQELAFAPSCLCLNPIKQLHFLSLYKYFSLFPNYQLGMFPNYGIISKLSVWNMHIYSDITKLTLVLETLNKTIIWISNWKKKKALIRYQTSKQTVSVFLESPPNTSVLYTVNTGCLKLSSAHARAVTSFRLELPPQGF